MVSYEDVLLRIRGQDDSSGAFSSAERRAGALKTTVGAAVTAMSASMLNYAKDAVSAAMTAEQEWNKFSTALENSGGNWDKQSDEVKKWVSDYSNNMGRSISDTRAAMTTYMNMGMSLEDSKAAMIATSNYAAQMGIDQETAAGQLQKAFMGNGKALKSLGLDINDYKDSTTGAIDKQRLLNDVLSRTDGAADKYADSNTAKFQRLNNVLGGLKTDFGAAILDAIQPLIPVVQGFLDMIKNLPGPVKTAGFAAIALGAGIGIIAGPLMSIIGLMETLGITLPTVSGLLGAVGGETAALSAEELALAAAQAGLTAEEIGAAAAHASNGVALGVEGAAATGASGGFWAMAAAELAALWPILAIAAAVAAFIVVVEQIGEALGWWTDFGTMLDSIKAGVMRLWNAFINSPQVQGTLKMIQNAFTQLWNALQPVFEWLTAAWNNLFKSEGAGSGGPDIVGQLIDLFGKLGTIAGDVFNTLVSWGTQAWEAIQPIVGLVGDIVNAFTGMLSGQVSVQDAIITIFNSILKIQAQIGLLIVQLGTKILTGIVNALRPLPGLLWQFLTQAAMRLLQFAAIGAARARNAGLRILMGIINYIQQIPGRVFNHMIRIAGRIAGAAGAAVSAAASFANQIKDAVINGILSLGDAVYQEFLHIGDRINDAVTGAVEAATNFADNIKNAVLGALGIASPGIIQRKVAIEFEDIPGRIGESDDNVYTAARSYARNILDGFSAPQMRLSTIGVARNNANYTPVDNTGRNITIVNVQEGAVPVDARNMTEKQAQGVVTLAFESIGKNPEGVGS